MSGCNKDRRSALVCAAYNVTDMNTVIIVVIMYYITRSKDNYRSLKVDADPRCRNHTPGYPNHEGPSARDIIKRK